MNSSPSVKMDRKTNRNVEFLTKIIKNVEKLNVNIEGLCG